MGVGSVCTPMQCLKANQAQAAKLQAQASRLQMQEAQPQIQKQVLAKSAGSMGVRA